MEALQDGTTTVVASDTTDTNGHYTMTVSAGTYDLRVGLYDPETQIRLPLTSESPGGPEFVDDCRRTVEELGVDPARLHIEAYHPRAAAEAPPRDRLASLAVCPDEMLVSAPLPGRFT